MEEYVGTKVIKAKPMLRGEYNLYRGWLIPLDEDPFDSGYLVEYEDGYISWSPQETFEAAYRKSGELDFGAALKKLKLGFRIARKGWNGKGMYVYYVPGGDYPTQTESAKKEFGETAHYNPYLAIKTVQGSVSTWVPSVNDCLADDWGVVE